MSQTPKQKRKRTVPKTIADKTDQEVMRTIFGKRILRKINEEAGRDDLVSKSIGA